MGPLDILNTAGSSLPTPTNFRAVQDPQRRNFFLLQELLFQAHCLKYKLSWLFPGRQKTVL